MRKFLFFGFVVFYKAHMCFAIGVIPFSHSINFPQDGRTVQYTVSNGFNRTVAFEIKPYRRKQDINGEDILTATKSISIYPKQMLIGPYGNRSFRLKYVDKAPKCEESYRIMITHHDINFEIKQKDNRPTAVKIKLQAGASLHITPEDTKPNIEVLSVKKTTVKGRSAVAVHVKNTGTKRMLTNDLTTVVRAFGKNIQLKDTIHKDDKHHVILAGADRIFNLFEDDVKQAVAIEKEAQKLVPTPLSHSDAAGEKDSNSIKP